CRNGITAFYGFGEHLAGVNQAQIFVGYHNDLFYVVNLLFSKNRTNLMKILKNDLFLGRK
ncbi:MAG: hypothetical protein RSB29_06940, partial [Alistipes sp.]